MTELEHFSTVAIAAIRDAGAIVLASLGRVERIERKGAIDFVTEVDRRAEAAIVAALTAPFPDHRIAAEEGSGSSAGPSPYRWLIDPIDGTTNYTHACPYFAVSIALQHEDETVLGVIYDPVKDELFRAERDGGACLNDQPLRVSTIAAPRDALIATDLPYDLAMLPLVTAQQAVFASACSGIRCAGASALDLCYVAAGRYDGFYEDYLEAWDCAAGALIVTEAGGRVTDYRGDLFDPFRGQIVASNGLLHEAMLAILAGTFRRAAGAGGAEDVLQ